MITNSNRRYKSGHSVSNKATNGFDSDIKIDLYFDAINKRSLWSTTDKIIFEDRATDAFLKLQSHFNPLFSSFKHRLVIDED
jgi:hypothetical protein